LYAGISKATVFFTTEDEDGALAGIVPARGRPLVVGLMQLSVVSVRSRLSSEASAITLGRGMCGAAPRARDPPPPEPRQVVCGSQTT